MSPLAPAVPEPVLQGLAWLALVGVGWALRRLWDGLKNLADFLELASEPDEFHEVAPVDRALAHAYDVDDPAPLLADNDAGALREAAARYRRLALFEAGRLKDYAAA